MFSCTNECVSVTLNSIDMWESLSSISINCSIHQRQSCRKQWNEGPESNRGADYTAPEVWFHHSCCRLIFIWKQRVQHEDNKCDVLFMLNSSAEQKRHILQSDAKEELDIIECQGLWDQRGHLFAANETIKASIYRRRRLKDKAVLIRVCFNQIFTDRAAVILINSDIYTHIS